MIHWPPLVCRPYSHLPLSLAAQTLQSACTETQKHRADWGETLLPGIHLICQFTWIVLDLLIAVDICRIINSILRETQSILWITPCILREATCILWISTGILRVSTCVLRISTSIRITTNYLCILASTSSTTWCSLTWVSLLSPNASVSIHQ